MFNLFVRVFHVNSRSALRLISARRNARLLKRVSIHLVFLESECCFQYYLLKGIGANDGCFQLQDNVFLVNTDHRTDQS